jgi:hypothetical protein
MNIEELESRSEYEKVGNGETNAFIMVFKPGCPPCRDALPEWRKLPTHYKGAKILQVNGQDVAKITDSRPLNIIGYPTFVYLPKNGEPDYYSNNDRTHEAFTRWMDTKLGSTGGGVYKHSNRFRTVTRKSRRRKMHKRKTKTVRPKKRKSRRRHKKSRKVKTVRRRRI